MGTLYITFLNIFKLFTNFGYTVYNTSINFGYIGNNFGYFGEFFSVYQFTTTPPPRPTLTLDETRALASMNDVLRKNKTPF